MARSWVAKPGITKFWYATALPSQSQIWRWTSWSPPKALLIARRVSFGWAMASIPVWK